MKGSFIVSIIIFSWSRRKETWASSKEEIMPLRTRSRLLKKKQFNLSGSFWPSKNQNCYYSRSITYIGFVFVSFLSLIMFFFFLGSFFSVRVICSLFVGFLEMKQKKERNNGCFLLIRIYVYRSNNNWYNLFQQSDRFNCNQFSLVYNAVTFHMFLLCISYFVSTILITIGLQFDFLKTVVKHNYL